MRNYLFFCLITLLTGSQCTPKAQPLPTNPKGALFIIGGGSRPPEMLVELLQISGLDSAGYAYILPMASEEPDTAFHYARKQFAELGVESSRIKRFTFSARDIEALPNARLIYLPGGDQVKFMNSLEGTEVAETLHRAWLQGATIAGTSAGAAVMSARMITGNERRSPEYTGEYRSIEADNIEIGQGLGFLEKAIIDQHFIYRMRLNRLVAVALEHPGVPCFGIDESTALVIQGDSARIVGNSQVVRLLYSGQTPVVKGQLLGGKDLKLDVLLPGETILW